MANRDGASGLTPRRHLAGGTIRTEQITLAAANTAFGVGAALVQTNAGVYDIWTSGQIDAVAAELATASQAGTIMAYVDPFIVYTAQTDDGTGTTTAQTAVNLNATIINNGSITNGRSIGELDQSETADTAGLPLRIIGIWGSPDNAFGEFNVLEVIINDSANRVGIQGI